MNSDIRLSVEFFDHPKTIKLERRLGVGAVFALQRLWIWAAKNRPDGGLGDMDEEDIEIAAKWTGEPGALLPVLLELRWLDGEGGYALHDWREHNAWASESDERGNAARLSRLARTRPDTAGALRADGVRGITADEYRRYAQGAPYARRAHSDAATPGERAAPGSAPSPSRKKKEDLKPPRSSGNEDRARDAGSARAGLGRKKETPSGEKAEQAPSVDPSLEFQELRAWYSEHGRPEGPLAGFAEYRRAKAARTWPGQTRLYDDLTTRSASDKWKRGYAPSLATYLRTRGWEAPPEVRASPPGPGAMTVRDAETLERNQRAKMLLAARAAREERHAQADGDAGAFDLAGAALPAGAVHE